MKKLMVVLALLGSNAHADFTPAQEEIADYQEQACATYNQVRNQLSHFRFVKQTDYAKNADGSFKAMTRSVPNTALSQAMLSLDKVCTGSVTVKSVDQLIAPLNQIRNNIWDSQIQLTLQQVLNSGFDMWSQVLSIGM